MGTRSARFATLLALVTMLSVGPTNPASAATRSVSWFVSPSGNIGCMLYGGVARCDLRTHTYRTPKRPYYCDLEYGDSISVGSRGKAYYTCHGDTVFGTSTVLKYGQTTRVGRLQCTSLTSGMSCVNLRTGHGFLISKSKHTRY